MSGSRGTMLRLVASVLLLSLSLPGRAVQLESATVTVDDTFVTSAYTTIFFRSAFSSTPVVFATATDQGGDPCAIKIRNVLTDRFDAACVEPTGNDGQHL